MAAGAQAQPGLFNLDKNLINSGFLDGNGALTVAITNNTNATAVQKILTNAPLGNDEFIVDNIEAKANATVKAVKFLSGAGSVGFQGRGDAYAELAVFPDPTTPSFATALGPVADTKFSIAKDATQSVVLLRWGADASVAGSGTIALASGLETIDFSAQANGELFFGVLQQTPRPTLTRDALANVVKSWKLPVHVRTPDDLAPRTHVMSEVGGALKASISATFGHQFNWIKQVTDKDLKTILQGDVGLKLKLGLTAAFSLAAQGKYAVVVSRETADPVIRVRIYKLKMHEFDFALSASVAATPSVPLPGSFDDLIKAVLGVHPLQISKELEDPNAINNWIQKYGPPYVTDLLKKFTGLDLNAAIQKLQGFIGQWKNLPHSAASLFAKLAEKEIPDFSQIQQIAQLVANKDAAGLNSELQKAINDLHLPFLSSPAGEYLEGIADKGILALLNHIPDDVQQAAKATLDFLNGQDVEKLLNNIETEIDKRLGLQTILSDLQGDPSQVLDKLLFDKLTTFLGKQPAFQDIQQLQTQLKNLMDQASTLYAKTVKALNDTYTAQLNATYQQTTTDTALIDASFDFGAADVSAPLRQLLAGQLEDFLVHPQTGVRLANGALTHQIQRHAHVDLTLPFLKIQEDWINTASAQFNAVDQQNGRLATYQFNGQDQQMTRTSWWRGQNFRSTTLSMTGSISELLPPNSTVKVYATTVAERKYLASGMSSLRMAVTNMSLADLNNTVEPFAVQFLRAKFADQAAFSTWAATGHLLEQPGNTLVSLDVSIPPEAISAWLNITQTDQTKEPYTQLSLTIQFLLKKYLSRYYFWTVDRYEDLVPASIVLLYAAIPPRTAFSAGEKGVYWNPTAPDQLSAMIGAANDNFKTQLQQAQKRLLAAGRNDLAAFYDPDSQITKRLTDATTDPAQMLKTKLLFMEALVVHGACDAAQNIANFNNLVRNNPQDITDALNALTDFGSKITEAFNTDLTQLFVQDNQALQRLAPLIFAQVSKVLDASVPIGENNSVLNVTVLNQAAAMPANFPDLTVDPKNIKVSLNAASFEPAAVAALGAAGGPQ